MGDGGTLLVLVLVIAGIAWWMRQGEREDGARRGSAGRSLALAVGGAEDAISTVLMKGREGLAIDPQGERLAVRTAGDTRTFRFSQLVAVEPLYDGRSAVAQGNSTTGALVGGALFGAAGVVGGAIVGGKSRVRRLSLKLYTDDLHQPVHEVVFLDSRAAVPLSHPWAKAVMPDFETWYGRLRVIAQRNGQTVRAA